MAAVTPEKVKTKIDKLHTRLRGYGSTSISLVLFANTYTDDFAVPVAGTSTVTALNPLPIVEDQPGDDIAHNFPGGIEADQKIFRIPPWSFVAFTPTSTLEQRAWDFLSERVGQDRGGINYNGTIYVIERMPTASYIGGIPVWYLVLGRAQRKHS